MDEHGRQLCDVREEGWPATHAVPLRRFTPDISGTEVQGEVLSR